MSTPTLTREMALRVGLAARELPGIAPAQLLEALIGEVGLPLSEAGLAGLSPKALKGALKKSQEPDAEPSGDDCRRALARLREGAGEEDSGLPRPQPYAQGDMPGSIRVALASNSAGLDGHFGSCQRFLIYQVSSEAIRLVDLRSTNGEVEAEDRNAWRAALLKDCQLLMVRSIGGPAAAKVVRAGVHPVKLPQGGAPQEVLAGVQKVLSGHPPPWLAKAMGMEAEERVRFDREETP